MRLYIRITHIWMRSRNVLYYNGNSLSPRCASQDGEDSATYTSAANLLASSAQSRRSAAATRARSAASARAVDCAALSVAWLASAAALSEKSVRLAQKTRVGPCIPV